LEIVLGKRHHFKERILSHHQMTAPINQKDPQGRPHGVWKYYRPNGTLWWREHWLHGVRAGLWEWYWKNGASLRKEYSLNVK
jgi:antitoxin component YwqK of YwqJK toxin-antitoxin module